MSDVTWSDFYNCYIMYHSEYMAHRIWREYNARYARPAMSYYSTHNGKTLHASNLDGIKKKIKEEVMKS